jgi:sugar phosphate isomerase/epimerase
MKSAAQDPARWVEAQQIPPGFVSFTLDCPYPLPEISAARMRALREWRDARSLEYLIHTSAGKIALGDPNPAVRAASIQETHRAIALAAQLDARLITVHPTPCPDAERATCVERERLQRKALIEICADAQAHGVVIALENMQSKAYAPGFVNMSSHFELLQEIAELGITLDVGHANMAGISLRDTVLRLGQRLQLVHVHDNDGSADQHLPVGRGTVDWLGLVEALVQIGYTGLLEFEFQGEANLLASKQSLEDLFR